MTKGLDVAVEGVAVEAVGQDKAQHLLDTWAARLYALAAAPDPTAEERAGVPFMAIGFGATALDAFMHAQRHAKAQADDQEEVKGILKKQTFRVIPRPASQEAVACAQNLLDRDEPRVDQRFGPATCIEMGHKEAARERSQRPGYRFGTSGTRGFVFVGRVAKD